MFCPHWIFEATSAQVALEFIRDDMPLRVIAAKYADGLADKYEELTADELATTAESFIRFLDEVDAQHEGMGLLNGFCFFRIIHDTQHTKRRLKPLFGSVDGGTAKRDYSVVRANKAFKAYIFAWRSGSAIPADAGWKLEQVTELSTLSGLAAKPVSVLDML